MRNKQPLLVLIVVLLLPALTGAATLEQLTANADCNAWSSEATILFRPGATMVLLVFSMQLADSSGAEIDRYDYEEWLPIPATETAVYPFGATWTAPLDRPATVTVTAAVYDTRGDSFGLTTDEVSLALACPVADDGGGEAPVAVCRHAARWWLHNIPQWPVESLTLGGVNHNQTQIARLLRAHHHGQIGRRLLLQLAVAKLNLANGATGNIGAEVAAADTWLATYPPEVRSRRHEPRQAARREALRLLRILCRWNHSGCPQSLLANGAGTGNAGGNGLLMDFDATGAEFTGGEFTGDLADYDTAEKAGDETINLGTLKAMFR